MKRLLIVVAASVLAGCATTDVVMGPPATCKGEVACKYRWGRALAWVTQNAAYRITQANETIVQTAGPLPNSPRPAISIVRIPNADGSETIQFQSGCDNMFGCQPSRAALESSFRAFVMDTAVPGGSTSVHSIGGTMAARAAEAGVKAGLEASLR